MRNSFLLAMLLALFAISAPIGSAETVVEKHRARITYYHDGLRTASGVKPRTGITVAAHPKFKFGSKVRIPQLEGKIGDDGFFIVQDRGSAVTSRKASGGKTEVIDVYVSSNKELRRMASTMPRYMDILVYK